MAGSENMMENNKQKNLKFGKKTDISSSIKEFIEDLKQQKLSLEHKMVSFDVKLFFTNVPLIRTIDIILKRIYEKNEIVTSIAKMNEEDAKIV